jgi:hypothetical protein
MKVSRFSAFDLSFAAAVEEDTHSTGRKWVTRATVTSDDA